MSLYPCTMRESRVKPPLDGNNYSVDFQATGGAAIAVWETPDRGGWWVRMGRAHAIGNIHVGCQMLRRGTQDVSATASASQLRHPLAPASFEAREREEMLDRLQHLRGVLPVLAQEMAAARRQAARLRSDNRQLAEQVRQLRAVLESRGRQSR